MEQRYSTISCPNCGKEHDITTANGPGWNTLDGLQAIVATVTPLFFGLVAVVFLRIIGLAWDFTLSAQLLLAVFIATAVIAFPFMVYGMIRYQKHLLECFDVGLYRIKCTCLPKNTFTVIRPVTMGTKQEDTYAPSTDGTDLTPSNGN